MKIKILFILFALLIPTSASSSDDNEALSLLSKLLGDGIEIINEHEIRYCPDNTCEIFRAPEKTPTVKLAEFVFLYLFHVSDYVYLKESFFGKEPFHKSAEKYEPNIRVKNEKYCKLKKQNYDCIIKSMKSTLGIKVTFGRYDEGEYNES